MTAIAELQGTPEPRGTYLDAFKTWAVDHKIIAVALNIISLLGIFLISRDAAIVMMSFSGLIWLQIDIHEIEMETERAINAIQEARLQERLPYPFD